MKKEVNVHGWISKIEEKEIDSPDNTFIQVTLTVGSNAKELNLRDSITLIQIQGK